MLIYAHNSNFDSSGANQLQVMHMTNAFSKLTPTTLVMFASKPHSDYDFGKASLVALKPQKNYYIRSFRLFAKVRQLSGDIYTRDLIVATLVKIFTTKKVYYEIHEIRSNLFWKIALHFAKKLDKIVAISEGLQKALPRHNNVIVLRDGVSENFFQKPKKVPKLSDKKVVLYIGSFVAWKGIQTIFEASRLPHNFQFVCVGGTKEQVQKLKIEFPKIKFFERITASKVPEYLYAADVLLIPNTATEEISAKYTSPLKLFEYLATNKPIVASDLPSIREVVSPKNVTFVKPDDANSLITGIDKALNHNSKISKNATLAKKHSWNKRAETVVKMFINL